MPIAAAASNALKLTGAKKGNKNDKVWTDSEMLTINNYRTKYKVEITWCRVSSPLNRIHVCLS